MSKIVDIKPKSCLAVVYDNGDIFIDSTIKGAGGYSSVARQGALYSVHRVSVSSQRKRGLDANALLHVWIKQLAGFMGESTIDTKQILKIKFGMPVLFEDEVKGKQLRFILKRIGWVNMDWQQKLRLCETWIPVTSAMTTSQLKQMMDRIKEWAMTEFNITLNNGKSER